MRRLDGFSLIELMIVTAIVAILAMIALPNYTRYVQRSNRTAAVSAVLDVASREARYYTTNNAYSSSMTALGYASDPLPVSSNSQHFYDVSVSVSNGSTNFVVTAQPYGNQANDTCGAFTYTDVGLKGVTTGTVKDCWKQ